MKKSSYSETQILKILKNEEWPIDALGNLTPWEYLQKHQTLENSSLGCH